MISEFALHLPGFDWGDIGRALLVIVAIPAIGGLIPFVCAVLSELTPEKRRDFGKW